MAVIASGVNSGSGFGSSDAVTSTNLNNHVNAATFVAGSSGSTDNDTLEVHTDGKLRAKDSSSKTTGITFAKMQHISTAKVLGRTTAGEGDVEEVTLDTDLSTVSASHNELATSKAIKDLVNGMRPKYVRASGGTANLTQRNLANGATVVYDIADFTATGNPSDFASSKITGILVQGFVKAYASANEIITTLPSGQTCRIVRAGGTGNSDTSNTMIIPIEAGQTSVTFTYNSGDTVNHNPYTETFVLGLIYQPSL